MIIPFILALFAAGVGLLIWRKYPDPNSIKLSHKFLSLLIFTVALIAFMLLANRDRAYLYTFPFLVATFPIAIVDLIHQRIPNRVNLYLAAFQTSSFVLAEILNLNIDLRSGILAGIVMFTLFLILNISSGGKLGMGDVKLSYVIGLVTGVFGYNITVLALIIMFLSSGLLSFILIVTRRVGRESLIAFGPFMLFGTWISLFSNHLDF